MKFCLYIYQTEVIPYFVNQHVPPLVAYQEMLQLSFLICVQWNWKGLIVSRQLLRQSGKKKQQHTVQVIFIVYIFGGVGEKNKQWIVAYSVSK